jgi:hypothetical protein
MSIDFRNLPVLPAADVSDADTILARDVSAERAKVISIGDLGTALTREVPQAGRAPRARLNSPRLAPGWLDHAAMYFGQISEIPDFMPIPPGWWEWAAPVSGIRKVINFSLEALRRGTRDVRDLTLDPLRMFSDVAGTTLIAGPGADVAAMRDSRGVPVLTQATAAARLKYAVAPLSGIRNILPVNTTNIATGAIWGVLRASRAAAATSATGDPAADITATSTDVNGAFLQAASLTLPAGQYSLSGVFKGTGWVMLQVADSTTGTEQTRAWFNLSTGVVGTVSRGGTAFTAATSAISVEGDGFRCTMTYTTDASRTLFHRFFTVDANAGNAVTAGATFRIEAPQLETGAVRTAYQRRVSEFDVTQAGQMSIHQLAFDGVDDFMSFDSNFAPAGAYTMAAVRTATEFPGGITFESAAAGTAIFFQSVTLTIAANTGSNKVDIIPAGWPSGAEGVRRLDMARVTGAAAVQAWRNGVLAASGITITGDLVPLSAISRLGRAGSTGRFLGGLLLDEGDTPLTEAERLMTQRYLAHKGGITL